MQIWQKKLLMDTRFATIMCMTYNGVAHNFIPVRRVRRPASVCLPYERRLSSSGDSGARTRTWTWRCARCSSALQSSGFLPHRSPPCARGPNTRPPCSPSSTRCPSRGDEWVHWEWRRSGAHSRKDPSVAEVPRYVTWKSGCRIWSLYCPEKLLWIFFGIFFRFLI